MAHSRVDSKRGVKVGRGKKKKGSDFSIGTVPFCFGHLDIVILDMSSRKKCVDFYSILSQLERLAAFRCHWSSSGEKVSLAITFIPELDVN